MLVLGIESTCDETAASVVRDGNEILSNVVSSQIDIQAQFGGVVPELACRRHVDVMIPVIEEALQKAGVSLKEIDLIAVACMPGLVGALMIGVTAAKALSLAANIPFVGVNHTEAHLFASLMHHPVDFPCLGVLLSGGHTALLAIDGIGHYRLIGQTVDDAIGEAFDKTAKILGFPYPGGPPIESAAKKGDKARYPFQAGTVKGRPFDFSFSGLKTAVLYATKDKMLTEQDKCDVAASFQQAAFQSVIQKIKYALKENPYSTLVFGGGVTSSRTLRALCADAFPSQTLIFPEMELALDNAAMIAGLGFHVYQMKGKGDPLDLEAIPTIKWT